MEKGVTDHGFGSTCRLRYQDGHVNVHTRTHKAQPAQTTVLDVPVNTRRLRYEDGLLNLHMSTNKAQSAPTMVEPTWRYRTLPSLRVKSRARRTLQVDRKWIYKRVSSRKSMRVAREEEHDIQKGVKQEEHACCA